MIPGRVVWLSLAVAGTMIILFTCGCDTHYDSSGHAHVESHTEHNHDGQACSGDHGEVATTDASAEGQPSAGQWCWEHDVPEAACTKCDPKLIAQFKAIGDWCAGHGLPESQCVPCDPSLEAKFAAMRPPAVVATQPAEPAPMVVERWRSVLRGPNDPTCDVESNQIRLLDRSIAAKAGLAVEPAATRRMSADIECPAEVRYNQTQVAHVTPRAAGVIVTVAVDLGDQMEAGDVLAVIDSAPLGKAKSVYIEARESLLIAQADLDRHHTIHEAIQAMLGACEKHTTSDELRERYSEVRIGDAKSRLLTTHARLELARQRYDREKGLVEKGISAQESFQTAKNALDQAEAEFAATHEAIDIEMEKEHLALERAAKVARVAADAARRALQIVGVRAEQITALDTQKDQALGRYELCSPIRGTVVSRHAVSGESAGTDASVFLVADLSSMWLMLSLEERDLLTARPGNPVLFRVDGLPGRTFHGKLDWISSEVDSRTRTVQARVTLPNPDGLLRANMFGSARVILRQNEEMLTVPAEAIQSDGCCHLVFVKQSDTLYRPRKVTLGIATDGHVEVLAGLSAGEPVVTTGSFLMKTEILKGSIGAGCCEVDPGR